MIADIINIPTIIVFLCFVNCLMDIIFNFVKGSDFVKYTKMMIADNLRVNNEFYICPVYNYLVKDNKRIGIYPIGKEFDGMYGLGTPKDLEIFLSLPISKKIG